MFVRSTSEFSGALSLKIFKLIAFLSLRHCITAVCETDSVWLGVNQKPQTKLLSTVLVWSPILNGKFSHQRRES